MPAGPDKSTRDAAMKTMMSEDFKDDRMDPQKNPMPFDGMRLIYGGFEPIVELWIGRLQRQLSMSRSSPCEGGRVTNSSRRALGEGMALTMRDPGAIDCFYAWSHAGVV